MISTKKLFFSATGNTQKRNANQADLNRAESEAKRLKSEMAKKDEINKSMHEWIFENNPSDEDGTTLLHWAAENGHLDICKSIMEENQVKNPKNKEGWTPLHAASKGSNTEIFKLIFHSVHEKNPKDMQGRLHTIPQCS